MILLLAVAHLRELSLRKNSNEKRTVRELVESIKQGGQIAQRPREAKTGLQAETWTCGRSGSVGLSQTKFSALLDISPATLRNWEQAGANHTVPLAFCSAWPRNPDVYIRSRSGSSVTDQSRMRWAYRRLMATADRERKRRKPYDAGLTTACSCCAYDERTAQLLPRLKFPSWQRRASRNACASHVARSGESPALGYAR